MYRAYGGLRSGPVNVTTKPVASLSQARRGATLERRVSDVRHPRKSLDPRVGLGDRQGTKRRRRSA